MPDPRGGSKLGDGGLYFIAAFAVIMGLITVGIATGVIESGEDFLEAPRWVGGSLGVALMMGGLAPLAMRSRYGWMRNLPGPVIVVILTAVANWLAFGPGDRAGTTTLGPVSFFWSDTPWWVDRILPVLIVGFWDLLIVATSIRHLRKVFSEM